MVKILSTIFVLLLLFFILFIYEFLPRITSNELLSIQRSISSD